jgi:hypothetical protein
MLKNDYRVMRVNWGFQHMPDTDIVYAVEQRCEEEGGEDKSKICTAVRSVNSSKIQANITNYFSK